MLSLHLSPKTARVSIAVCTLVAAAACNGDGVTAPPDFTLTPIVTFDDLKAALVEARNEQTGGHVAGEWAAAWPAAARPPPGGGAGPPHTRPRRARRRTAAP